MFVSTSIAVSFKALLYLNKRNKKIWFCILKQIIVCYCCMMRFINVFGRSFGLNTGNIFQVHYFLPFYDLHNKISYGRATFSISTYNIRSTLCWIPRYICLVSLTKLIDLSLPGIYRLGSLNWFESNLYYTVCKFELYLLNFVRLK